MPTLKETLLAILFITFASAIMMLAVAQLDSSAWAEGVRAEYSAETTGEGEASGEFEGMSGPLMLLAATVGSALKITLLMGLPGLITIGVLRLVNRNGKRSPAGAAPS